MLPGDDKVVRMAAWFARHEGDLDSDKAMITLMEIG